MSIAESPVITVKRFSNSWGTLNNNQLKAELESIHKETHRKPDTYHFRVEDKKLIDPNTNRPVEEFVYAGTEGTVFLKLQEWATKNDAGLAIWISPPLENVYPCAKAILSRIAYDITGKKYILNSAITMDLTEEIYNSRFKRGNLYEAEDKEENIAKILSWIERKTNQKVKIADDSQKQTEYYVELINQGHSAGYVITEMEESGYIGQSSISCPTSLYLSTTTSFFGYSKESGYWKPGKCRDEPNGCGKYKDRVGPCKICDDCENDYNTGRRH